MGQLPVYRQLVSALYEGVSKIYYTTESGMKDFRQFVKPRVYCDQDKYFLEWRIQHIDNSVTEDSIAKILEKNDVKAYDVKRSGNDILVRYTYTTYDFFNQKELKKRKEVPDNIKKRWSDGKMGASYYTFPTVLMISEIWIRMEQDAKKQIEGLQNLLRQIYIGRVIPSKLHENNTL
jgi:hypothetical protein